MNANNINCNYNGNNGKFSLPYMNNTRNEDAPGSSLLEIKKRKQRKPPTSTLRIELIPCMNSLT